MRLSLLLIAALAGLGAAPAGAEQPRRGHEGEAAARAVRNGDILPLSVILDRIRIPDARLIDVTMIAPAHYRLRYMRGDSVLWIDVDARTGRIVGSAGL